MRNAFNKEKHVWKRTLLGSAIALASSQMVNAAECDAVISTKVDGCDATIGQNVTISAKGEVSVTDGDTALYVESASLAADITNNGKILASESNSVTSVYAAGIYATSDMTGSILNQGLISASVISTISGTASAYGLYMNGDIAGFSNSGVISAKAESVSDYAYAYGLYANGNAAEAIINNKTIMATATGYDTASAYGIYINGSTTGLTNSGIISAKAESADDFAYAYGLFLSGTANDTILNNKTIMATASAYDTATAYGVYNDNNATQVINNGMISASATSETDHPIAYGVYIGGDIEEGFENKKSITATARSLESNETATAYGVYIVGDADGVFINNGNISGMAYATSYEASAYGIYIAGDLNADMTNTGIISALADTSFSPDGTYAYAYGAYIDGDVDGDIINQGTINAQANAYTCTAQAYGLYVNGDMNGSLTNNGNISGNAFAATYSATAWGIYISGNANDITNNGVISASTIIDEESSDDASVTTLYIGGSLDGTLLNKGTISAYARATNAGTVDAYGYGIYIGGGIDVDGSITNNGTISSEFIANDSASIYGSLYISGTIDGDITNNGSILATATGFAGSPSVNAIDLTGTLNGTLTNNGIISAKANGGEQPYAYGLEVGTLGATGAIINNRSITADVDGGSSAYAYGVYGDDLDGELTNNGSIKATAESVNYNASAYGVYFNSTTHEGSFTNDGTIKADSHSSNYWSYAVGVEFNGTYEGTIDNNKIIMATAKGTGTSGASAYAASISALDGALTNTGSITAIAEHSTDVSAYALEGSEILDGGSITNDGTITAQAYSIFNTAQAYAVEFSSTNDGDVTNTSSGTIKAEAIAGTNATAWGMYFGSGDAVITNDGLISVLAESLYYSAEAYGIQKNDADGDITNNGDIIVYSIGPASAQSVGIETDELDAIITNTSLIDVKATATRQFGAEADGIYVDEDLLSSGGIVNTASGKILAYATGVTEGTAYGININGSVSGDITNDGLIEAIAVDQASSAFAYGVNVDDEMDNAATFTNSGSIIARAEVLIGGAYDATADGVTFGDLEAGATLINTSTGVIEATAISPNYEATAYGIRVDTIEDADTSLTNDGTISALASAATYAFAAGIQTDNMDTDSQSISNSGSITASASSESSDATVYGIEIEGPVYGALTNTGTIDLKATAHQNAYAYGIRGETLFGSGNGGSLVNDTGASISAIAEAGFSSVSAYGIRIDAINSTGAGAVTVTNNGDITASAYSGKYAAYAYGMSLGSLSNATNSGDTISNDGSITVMANSGSVQTGASAYGIVANSPNNYDGTIENTGSIMVTADASEGTYANAYGMSINGSVDTDIKNDGTIEVNAFANSKFGDADAYGVYLGNLLGGNTFTNTADGVIAVDFTGSNNDENDVYAIYVNGGGDIVNEGKIVGHVYTSGGGDYTSTGSHTLLVKSVIADQKSNISGDADFTGTEFAVMATDDAVLVDGQNFEKIIDVAGTLTISANQLGPVDDNRLLYDFELAENADDADDLDLLVSRKDLKSVTGDMYAGVAAALDKMYNEGLANPANKPSPELNALIAKINNAESAGDIDKLLGAASPVMGGQTAFASSKVAESISHVVNNRVAELGMGAGDEMFANRKAWVKIVSNDGSRDETSDANGYDIQSGGVILGVDHDYKEDFTLGVALALTSGEVEGKGAIADQEVETENNSIFAYGDWSLGDKGTVTLNIGFGTGENELTTASGSTEFDSSTFSASVGYHMGVALNEKWHMEPIATLTYISVEEDAYEIGLVEVDDNEYQSMELALGSHFEYSWKENLKVTSHAGLSFDLLGEDSDVDVTFANGGAGYTSETEQDHVGFQFGVGLDLAHTEAMGFSVNYDFKQTGDFNFNTLSAKVNYKF